MQTATKKAKQIYSKKVKMVKVYLFLRCKLVFALIKDRDILRWTYRNVVDLLLKSRITISKTYIFPSSWKVWNTKCRIYFDWNSKNTLLKMEITITP